jgi:hypothetical protein
MAILNIRTWALIAVSLYCLGAKAQDNWFDPSKNLEGQAWPEEVAKPYDRLPARAEKTVQPKVWELSHQSAGLSVRFRTTSREIIVRYAVAGKLDMPHMPATGVSGVDLYAIDPNGNWKWAAGKYTFGDTITYRFSRLSDEAREYRLYLPLYNSVKWMEIGGDAVITPVQRRRKSPS